MRKRISAAVGLSLVLLTAIALSTLPTQSGQDVETRLHALGLPADAELGVVAMDSDGVFWDVIYTDRNGERHVLIHRVRPKATPRPAP